MWILPNASVVIQMVRRDCRPVSRPKVVRSTSRATATARARSLCVIMLRPYTLTSVAAYNAGGTRADEKRAINAVIGRAESATWMVQPSIVGARKGGPTCSWRTHLMISSSDARLFANNAERVSAERSSRRVENACTRRAVRVGWRRRQALADHRRIRQTARELDQRERITRGLGKNAGAQ